MSDTFYAPNPSDQPPQDARVDDLVDRQPRPLTYRQDDLVDRLPRPPGTYQRVTLPQRLPAPPTPQPQQPPQPQQAPQPYEPYIPSRADRPYHQWGTDDWIMQGARRTPGMYPGPYMPQARDLAGLIHGAVMGLGRFGSRYTGMPAIAMGTYASAYWKAYQAGMHQRAGSAYQQYRQARQMTIDRGKEEMAEFAKVYALYHKDGKITDANGFSQALLDVAKRYQNHNIINAIESGDLAGAERILGVTDKHIADLIKGQHQEERAAKRDARLEHAEKRRDAEFEWRKKHAKDPNALPPEWRTGPTEGEEESDTEEDGGGGAETIEDGEEKEGSDEGADAGGGGGSPGETETPALARAPKSDPIRLAEADTGTKTDAGTGGATPKRAPPRYSTQEEIDRRIEDFARAAVRGQPLPKGLPKPIESRIAARQGDLDKELGNIVTSGATGEDMRNKLKAFDPELAQTVDNIVDGSMAMPSTGGFGAAAGANIRRLGALAKAIRPEWGQEIATARREFLNPNLRSQITLKAAASMPAAAREVQEALQFIKEDSRPDQNFVQQVASKVFTGSPEWNRLGAALNTYAEEAAKLARGGQSAEGDITRILEKYSPVFMGPKAIRALLAVEAGGAIGKVQAEVNAWKGITGKNTLPITYDPEAMRYLTALRDLNMMTGYVKPGTYVPDEMRPYLGPAGTRYNEIAEGLRRESPPAGTLNPGAPKVPAGSPSGSKIMYDKEGKPWLVHPDESVHRLPP